MTGVFAGTEVAGAGLVKVAGLRRKEGWVWTAGTGGITIDVFSAVVSGDSSRLNLRRIGERITVSVIWGEIDAAAAAVAERVDGFF
jgi:hypothetical protein